MNQAGSVAIIGGADGPTAVYVTGKLSSHPLFLAGIAVAVLLVAMACVWAYKKWRGTKK